MVTHQGLCLVHRAELMTLEGAWDDALEEVRLVGERFDRGALNERALGHAAYRQGEVHRLQGAFDDAERAYRESNRLGREPQPGMSLMRLAQGRRDDAAAAIRRALGEATRLFARVALLPSTSRSWSRSASSRKRAAPRSSSRRSPSGSAARSSRRSAQAAGSVALADGDAAAALPHFACLARVAGARGALRRRRSAAAGRLACRALGDEDAAALELEAARGVFARCGARPEPRSTRWCVSYRRRVMV